MENKLHSFSISGFHFNRHAVGIKRNCLFTAPDFFFCLQTVAVFHFASAELTLSPFLSSDLGDPTERHWLAAVNNVSPVRCIRFLSALAQTCGPFLHCLDIMSFYEKKRRKKRFYIHLSHWTLAQRIHCMIPGMSIFCLHS